MRGWLLLALLASLLSGCTGDEEPDEGVTLVTAPNDFSYLQNGTATAGLHLHDYWSGKDRLDVLDEERRVTFTLNGGQYGSALFAPEAGSIVPQGTASVEAVLEWTDQTPADLHGDLELWVRTQNMSQPLRIGQAEQGEPLAFATTLADADLPHQVVSAWEFTLRILTPEGQPGNPATGQFRSYDMDVHLRIAAIRGLEIPLFPGHPDRWGNATELPLVTEGRGSTLFWSQEPPGCGYCSGGIAVVRPDNGTIVPQDAAAVEVTLTSRADTPTRLRLLYHGADTREWKDAPAPTEVGEVRTYVIHLAGDGDGPYATQSLWGFYFGFEDGAGPYAGEWSLAARVLRDA